MVTFDYSSWKLNNLNECKNLVKNIDDQRNEGFSLKDFEFFQGKNENNFFFIKRQIIGL